MFPSVLSKTSTPEVIVKEEEDERVGKRFAGVGQQASIKASESAIGIVYLVGCIDQSCIFLLVSFVRVLPVLSLDLKSGNDQVKWIGDDIGDRGAGGTSKTVLYRSQNLL